MKSGSSVRRHAERELELVQEAGGIEPFALAALARAFAPGNAAAAVMPYPIAAGFVHRPHPWRWDLDGVRTPFHRVEASMGAVGSKPRRTLSGRSLDVRDGASSKRVSAGCAA